MSPCFLAKYLASCGLDVPPIRHTTSPHASGPVRRSCFLTRWCTRLHNLCVTHARHYFPLLMSFRFDTFQRRRASLLCRLRYAACTRGVLRYLSLGQLPCRPPMNAPHRRSVPNHTRPLLARAVLEPRREVGRAGISVRNHPLGTLFLRPQSFRTSPLSDQFTTRAHSR
jgi:hypothetical protein